MRKASLFILLMSMIVMSMVSCKKDKESDNEGNHYSGVYWKIDGTEYKLQKGTRVSRATTDYKEVIAAGVNDGDFCSFSVQFKAFPTASKVYKVSDMFNLSKEDECSITLVSTKKNLVTSAGEDGDVVNVTVKDGKISIEFSDVKAKGLMGSDKFLISGKVYE